MSDRKILGELTIEEFDELIEGYIERGGPDAVSVTVCGEVLADLEVESVQEAIEVTSVVNVLKPAPDHVLAEVISDYVPAYARIAEAM